MTSNAATLLCCIIELRNTNGKLTLYKLFKRNLAPEPYLTLPSYLRIPISKLRTSAHALRIETGQYATPSPIPADQRTCWFCNNSEIEDEPHFLFSCKLYDELLERSPLLKYCSSLNCSFPHLSVLDKELGALYTRLSSIGLLNYESKLSPPLNLHNLFILIHLVAMTNGPSGLHCQ